MIYALYQKKKHRSVESVYLQNKSNMVQHTIKNFKFVQEITVPNKYFEQINVYVTNAINNRPIHRSSTNANT